MTAPPPPEPPPPPPAQPPAPPEFDIPNAEKYMLEADVMRRRQLRSALLHGSHRTWREHRKVWPGVVAGLVAAGLFVAITAVKSAYDKDKENTEIAELEGYCQITLDSQDTLLEPGGVDLKEHDEIDDAADTARSLETDLPDSLEDRIGDSAATISNTYQTLADRADTTDDPDELAEVLNQRRFLKARDDMLKFNDDDCDT